ncbi:MAG: DNA-processing protein DprA [Candidatus Binatia bacterium]
MVEPSLSFTKGNSAGVPTRDPYAPWLALSRVKGLGGVGFKRLAGRFSDPTQAFFASRAELEQVEGLHRDVIDALANFSAWLEVDDELRRTREAGVTIVPFNDPSYPGRLRMIADPPPVLYMKGAVRAEDDRAVAIVGSRSASDYGRRVARDLARGLAALGFTVVSGMARGIDGTAHECALQAGGRTIAVLGSGVERAYPPEHERLYRRINESGAVISELPVGTRPLAFNFPARNRLISGLSLGVVVVEATEKSGSLITAALALEQAREVFAVPGEVGASRSRGSHRLIRQGAKLVETVDDIIEEIAPQLVRRGGAAETARVLAPSASASARKIFEMLQDNSLQVDQVIERSGLPAAQVLEILLDLELQGFIRQAPGKIYAAER